MFKKIRVKLSRKCVKELDNFYSCQLFLYQAVNFSSYQDLKSLVKPVLNMQYRAVGTGWAEVPIQMVEMLTHTLLPRTFCSLAYFSDSYFAPRNILIPGTLCFLKHFALHCVVIWHKFRPLK